MKLGGFVLISEGDETEVSSVSNGFGLVNGGPDAYGYLTSVGTCVVSVFHVNAGEEYFIYVNCIDSNCIANGSPLQILDVSATSAIGSTYYVCSGATIYIEAMSYYLNGVTIQHRVASVTLSGHGLSVINGNLVGQIESDIVYIVVIESVLNTGAVIGTAHCTIVSI